MFFEIKFFFFCKHEKYSIPIEHFRPIMLDNMTELARMVASGITTELQILTPPSMMTFAPMQTFGPIDAPRPILALRSIRTGGINYIFKRFNNYYYYSRIFH